MREDFLWVERYRPKRIIDCALTSQLKATFQKFVDSGNVPNLILSGGPGVGKTTVAKAMCEELGSDYIVINGSMNGNIDTLRNEIMQFASSVSLQGGRKYVILDEADYLNANSTQPALRNFMEEYSANCGFILTCNFKNRIIEPLHSRCSVIDFTISKEQKSQVAKDVFTSICGILKAENVEYVNGAVAEFVKKYFPDNRRIINELQRYSATGIIDNGILANLSEENFDNLVQKLKDKDFTEVRKWIAFNSDSDPTALFRKLYDKCSGFLKPNSVPQLILILSEYQYKTAFVADQEINITACLTEIMANCEFS
jgi:DNA polymerase III delta prime subunit